RLEASGGNAVCIDKPASLRSRIIPPVTPSKLAKAGPCNLCRKHLRRSGIINLSPAGVQPSAPWPATPSLASGRPRGPSLTAAHTPICLSEDSGKVSRLVRKVKFQVIDGEKGGTEDNFF